MINRFPTGFCATLLGFAFLCCASTLSYAAGDGDWYAAAKVSFSEDTMENHTVTGVGTGVVIDGQIDGSLDNDTIDDYTAGVGFAVGRRIGDWNISGEYIYRYRTDWDLVIATPSIQAITNIFSNVESHILIMSPAACPSTSIGHGRLAPG